MTQDPPRILIADDEEDVHIICRVNLEIEGFDVTSARNGMEALEFARTSPPPDLVLLDIMMPVMDGWTCLESLKQDVSLRGIPVVLLTAKVQQSDQIRGLLAGASDYVTKPFHPTALIRAVRAVLGANSDERESRRVIAIKRLEVLQRV